MNRNGVLRQVVSPFRYYQFFNYYKLSIDILLPAIFSLATCVVFYFVPKGVAILGDNGFVHSINGLLQILTGFFVAGLAAVFGVRGVSLEQEPIGFKYFGSVKIDREEGVVVTRRMFVCSLFGYLAFSSFSLYLMGLIASICEPLFRLMHINSCLHFSILFMYAFVVWNIFFVTVYGLYYMVDRAHRSDPKVIDGPVGDGTDEG
ncbi:hypothetical protein [Oleiagrimonas soli]|uniref:Uncharacterized protein n=1 Tax=Oleiagrimonas soli TaxID=1543381 RepID=A0A841KED7_9GAMM|nr:hypothetical protein [Oleiagrimonas soli]MBB6183536.1 hypothetical protein [Oleiagrimonas soli]